jgi:hypothetical protein
MSQIETVRIDKTEDVKEGMAATWDATNKRATTMAANPSAAQIAAFVGVFNQNRQKLSDNFGGSAVYSDQLGIVTQGPAYVEVDGAVEVGDLLMFSASVAGKFTKRTFATLAGTYSHTEVEAEVLKQSTLPRIKAQEKATGAKKIKVMIGSL